jgi:hypothetical protein
VDDLRRDHLKIELAQADRHIAEGQEHIAKQIRMIDSLDHDGRDSTLAREFLAVLHTTLQMHEDHREHIIRELGA